ncbi:Uncharacterised protein [Yersinia pseudotuberculosis]|nr:Uncharacterised protein [Yersinia pseudotuberculosis]
MWLPFWDSLDAIQKEDYLIANAAPLGWVEYFNFHEAHIRKINDMSMVNIRI